jgi:hypothetical protein
MKIWGSDTPVSETKFVRYRLTRRRRLLHCRGEKNFGQTRFVSTRKHHTYELAGELSVASCCCCPMALTRTRYRYADPATHGLPKRKSELGFFFFLSCFSTLCLASILRAGDCVWSCSDGSALSMPTLALYLARIPSSGRFLS